MNYPEIDPVAIAIGPLQVNWYGLMYLMGIAGAWALMVRRSKKDYSVIARDQVDDLIFYGAAGVILGGRVGYVLFYGWDHFVQDPLWLFKVWEGGMSFHGGLLGVIVAMLLYARKIGQHPMDLLDFGAPMVPIGLGMGRIGNFIGQELWGRASDVPWAMVFPRDPLGLARHPSQLYQAALEGLLLFVILYLYSAKPRPRWAVSGLFLICYGSFRFMVEFVREPDSNMGMDLFGLLTRGQMLSLPMVIVGALLMYHAYHQRQARS